MTANIYLDHFGFSERPFSLLPDPDFLFWSEAHARAFAVLEYGLSTHAPITVITGEVGTGKTTLLQAILGTIDEGRTVGLLSNATSENGSLLRWVLDAFNIPHTSQMDNITLFQTFVDFVLNEYAGGKLVVLIIDEAQNLSPQTLEELRMLTNVNSNKDELLQLILLGQPELRSMIMRPELRQFSQRVSVTYHIKSMNEPTTRNYIKHRLRHVGGTGQEISDEAIARVFEMSGGIPRLINKICDLALVYAVGAEKEAVDVSIIEELEEDGTVLIPRAKPFLLTERIDTPNKAAE